MSRSGSDLVEPNLIKIMRKLKLNLLAWKITEGMRFRKRAMGVLTLTSNSVGYTRIVKESALSAHT